jgi:hypothetical protein
MFNQIAGITVATVNNPIVNLANWGTEGLQSLATLAIIGIGLYLFMKRKLTNIIGFAVLAGIASVFIWNPSALKDVGNLIWKGILGL